MLPYLLSENRAGINLACTPTIPDGSEISSLSLLIESINKLIRPENLKTFVNTQDLSLLTACPVVNNRNWMITRLAASTRNTETMPLLVALMAKELAKLGANRIVVRIKKNGILGEFLKQSGFKYSHTESLFEGTPTKLYQTRMKINNKCESDDLAIFRLYNKTTPVKVRSLLCPTLADWKDIYGQYKNIANEYTLIENSEVTAYLKTYRSKRTQIVTLIADPEYNYNIIKHLLQFSLTVLNEINEVKVYIPDFHISTHKAASAIDLFKSTIYDIYVLPITASQKLAIEETAVGYVT